MSFIIFVLFKHAFFIKKCLKEEAILFITLAPYSRDLLRSLWTSESSDKQQTLYMCQQCHVHKGSVENVTVDLNWIMAYIYPWSSLTFDHFAFNSHPKCILGHWFMWHLCFLLSPVTLMILALDATILQMVQHAYANQKSMLVPQIR